MKKFRFDQLKPYTKDLVKFNATILK